MHAKNTYTPERVRQIQAELKAAESRNRVIVIAGAIGAALLLLVAGVVLALVAPAYTMAVAVVALVVIVAFVFVGDHLFPGLKCPGCLTRLVGSFGVFCPACGGYGLESISGQKVRCRTCTKTLRYWKNPGSPFLNRNFKVKNCTGCGVHLGLNRNGI